jgi:phage terminase large subunit GpA-like protein
MNNKSIQQAFAELIDEASHNVKTITPVRWNEEYRTMSRDITPFPGPFSFERFPYAREIVNRFDPADPAKKIAFQKGAQVAASTSVIEAGIGYRIDVAPCNMLFLTGHEELSREAMNEKVDQLLQSTGLKQLIKPNTRSNRTGDTATHKEFPGGVLKAGYAGNHKLLRQRSVQVIVVDDFDAAKSVSKESGSTQEMIEFRQAAYYNKMKLFMISTPELKQTSNIEPAFLAGDQRYFYVPCPLCKKELTLMWRHQIDEHEQAGMTWQVDNKGNLLPDTVGYICPNCAGFFTERNKQNIIEAGYWQPTAAPSEPDYVSYFLNALYTPPGMFDWIRHVRSYLQAYPPNGSIDERRAQTFQNLVLGCTYEEAGSEPVAVSIQKNVRPYEVGEIPEALSQKDGNGKIVLLTCAADLNGKIEDARLDYEVLAWSESGATYSVQVGSIGTFIPRESEQKEPQDREKYTYELQRSNSVWPVFEEILGQAYKTDNGRRMAIMASGIDAPGQFATQAYSFLESTNRNVVALKGKDFDNYVKATQDVSTFKFAKERGDLYLVEVNYCKDMLAQKMELNWKPSEDAAQPAGFMNFPQPAGGYYTYKDFFAHFESEQRVVQSKKDGTGVSYRWVKKPSAQNHFWDIAVYQMALKDIVLYYVFKEIGQKHYTWSDYVNLIKKN